MLLEDIRLLLLMPSTPVYDSVVSEHRRNKADNGGFLQ